MITRMKDADYFAIDAISNSKLSRLAKCPAALDIEFETTPAMLLGTLAHCLILEGRNAFNERYAVAPDCDKRTTVGKATWQKFVDENWGMKVITLDQLNTVADMAKSIASHPAACDLLQIGEPELAVTWEEDIDGELIPAKAKCDWLSATALIDLKTCQDSSYPMFSKTIFNSGYHRQFGFYRRGLAANGIFPEHHIIIAVESKAPYTVNCFELAEEVLDYGEGQSMELLKKYAQVQYMDVKPAYTYAGISNIRLPQWMKEME
jgi:hypothetical protein